MDYALLDVYKKELDKYKAENALYQMKINEYNKLGLPKTDTETDEEFINKIFNDALIAETTTKEGDETKVKQLIQMINKPIPTLYIDDIIKYLENLIFKLEKHHNNQ